MLAGTMVAVVCGPTIVSMGLSCLCLWGRVAKNRWSSIQVKTEAKPKRKLSLLPVAETSERPFSQTSFSTATPLNRDVSRRLNPDHKQPPYQQPPSKQQQQRPTVYQYHAGSPDMAAAFFRESLLNTRGRILAGQLNAQRQLAYDVPKLESCEADTELSDGQTRTERFYRRPARPSSSRCDRQGMAILREDSLSSEDNRNPIVRYMCWSPPRKPKRVKLAPTQISSRRPVSRARDSMPDRFVQNYDYRPHDRPRRNIYKTTAVVPRRHYPSSTRETTQQTSAPRPPSLRHVSRQMSVSESTNARDNLELEMENRRRAAIDVRKESYPRKISSGSM